MNTLVALALAAAVRTRIVRLAEGLASQAAAFMASLNRRVMPIAPPVAGAGIKPPVVLVAVLVAAAGCPVLAPIAVFGLKHLAVACALDVVLRRAPWGRLATAGRGLRAAAAVGLLWLASASFDAGRTVAPWPMPGATVGIISPAFAAAFVPGVDAACPPADALPERGADRPGRRKAALRVRA